MEITLNQVQKILDSCPIGYYLNTSEIDVVLDEKAQTSYYNATNNVITISYPLIQKQLSKAEEYSMDLEMIVRSLLYHELSHAILTPIPLFDYVYSHYSWRLPEVKDMVNIVEDERIERRFKDYYMNVDFKANIKNALDFNKLDLTNSNIFKGMQGFLLCTRLGIGTKEMQDDLNTLLEKYKSMIGTKESYFYRDRHIGYHISEYIRDIIDYYNKYFISSSPTSEELKQMLQQLMDLMGNDKSTEKGKGQPDDEKQEGEGEGEPTGENAHGDKKGNAHRQEISQIIDKVVSQGFDGKLYQQLLSIFERTQIVEKMTSGASSGYSGVFNPRNCVRKDYKYFLHQDNKGDNKGFSKLHLNLFIDVSGSFHRNTDVTNKLLTCLKKVEKVNPNFTFDLVTINEKAELRPRDKRFIQCSGGNKLPLVLKDLYFKMYKRDAVNYNLILFDGDCLSDTWNSDDRQRELKNFLTLFDNKTTTIISDSYNQTYFNKAKTAKIIYCSNYVEELTNRVAEVLQVAFG